MKTNSPMPEMVSDKICVLYNPEDGRIVHVHRSSTLAGGKITTDKEVEVHAKENAAAAGHRVETLHVLHLPAEAYDTSKFFVVDVTEKRLVEREKPRHAHTRPWRYFCRPSHQSRSRSDGPLIGTFRCTSGFMRCICL
jgi:hypothetical protein